MKYEGKKQFKYIVKTLQCQNCGEMTDISFKANKDKSNGHYIHVYCTKCRKTTKHVEI